MLKHYGEPLAQTSENAERHTIANELPYLELHLTDHCNLNCDGCLHFSSMSPHHFADIEQFKADMMRLTQLFGNIQLNH